MLDLWQVVFIIRFCSVRFSCLFLFFFFFVFDSLSFSLFFYLFSIFLFGFSAIFSGFIFWWVRFWLLHKICYSFEESFFFSSFDYIVQRCHRHIVVVVVFKVFFPQVFCVSLWFCLRFAWITLYEWQICFAFKIILTGAYSVFELYVFVFVWHDNTFFLNFSRYFPFFYLLFDSFRKIQWIINTKFCVFDIPKLNTMGEPEHCRKKGR